MIEIKKYPNRRLYDTSQSKYVNLDYVKNLIKSHADFKIVDSKTGDDLTKSVLLQIISESESSDQQPILTEALLKQLIRFYDSEMQPVVRQYLEHSIVQFIEQQDALQGVMKNMVDNTPLAMFQKMMDQSIDSMKAWNTNKKDS